MRTVVMASDLEAGYAAGGYARTKGLGAASVAYGVGALSMIYATAGGSVERSPVVVVNGGPTPGALSYLRQFDVVPSYLIGQDATDFSAYKLVTPSATRAGTVAELPPLVDAASASAIRTKHPSHIQINMGIWDSACPIGTGPLNALAAARISGNCAARITPTMVSATTLSAPAGRLAMGRASAGIAAQVDAHGLPAELTGAALVGGGPLR